MTTPILGSLYSVYNLDIEEYVTGYVSYIGKYGYTLTAMGGTRYSVRYEEEYRSKPVKFISNPINPFTNEPYTPEEIREYYPEYFL